MKWIGLTVVALSVLALASCGNESPDREVVGGCGPDAPLLVYSREADQSYHYDLVAVDRDWQTRVLTDDHRSSQPRISPDGRRIAFVKSWNYDEEASEFVYETIHVMNTDGSGGRGLTKGFRSDEEPEWSADGEQIAFVHNYNSLGAVDAGGGGPRQITPTEEGSEDLIYEITWSPDGGRIAYTREQRIDYNSASLTVWAAQARGGDPEQLVASNEGLEDAGYSPAWSPDGERIAFVRPVNKPGPANAEDEIRIMDANSGKSRLLLRTEDVAFLDLEWSPDGEALAFDGTGGGLLVGVIELDDPRIRRLGRGYGLQWTPDGKHLVYARDRGDYKPQTLEAVTIKGEEVPLPEGAPDDMTGRSFTQSVFDWGPCTLDESRRL